jgi:spore coat protein SA
MHKVRFLGYVAPEALAEYYAVADVVALASYANETFSIMSVEAMASARPVVATRFGGIPEVVVDGETGLLATPEDAADLADKLEQLLANEAVRLRLGECGRSRALQHFTWDHVADRVMDAYRAVTAKPVTQTRAGAVDPTLEL